MRTKHSFGLVALTVLGSTLAWSAGADRAVDFEARGDLASARSALEQQSKSDSDPSSQAALAGFLDRHRMAGRREAYLKLAEISGDEESRRAALRQIIIHDALEGDKRSLAGAIGNYKAAGGKEFAAKPSTSSIAAQTSFIYIPGPIRSFARMAALSPDLEPSELLQALARNVVTNGFQAVSSNEALEQTEYLKLLVRYIAQARELEQLAGPQHKIVIPTCDSEQTANLLRILGYRMRGSCGGDLVLETVNASKAFLTVDSAFPLSQLEADLRSNRKFELPFAPTKVSVLYDAKYWMSALSRNREGDFIDAFLSEPSMCRLYLGLSKLDRVTAEALRRKATPARLKAFAHVLDFYGSMFQIRNGAAVVPGSPRAWQQLTGTSPADGAAFYERLMTIDDGWLASYYDAIARIEGPTQAYLTEPERLKRFYGALRGKVTTPGPARPVFRSSTELLLLTTGLKIEKSGQPHVPGDIEVWRRLFLKHPHGKYDGKLTRSAKNWRDRDDVLEALFALCRKTVENEPLKIFLALNDIDRERATPLSADLASRLAVAYRTYGSQYPVFVECPSLSETSIQSYMDLFVSTSNIRDNLNRADTMGTVQSLVGIWQILCRQHSIPVGTQDRTFAAIIKPYAGIKEAVDVFEATRSGVGILLAAAKAPEARSQQDRLVDLLVGIPSAGTDHPGPAETFAHVFDAQRLLTLDSLYAVVDHSNKGKGDAKALSLVTGQLTRFEEVQSLRSSLSSAERNLLALGYWSERHIEQERKANVEALLKGSEKKDARAVLLPFLRDTLVGVLYSYYAPPGAQILLTNPLFVRNHDFIGAQSLEVMWRPTDMTGSGWPASAGGRLLGSLISLPYALAQAEQNFLTPSREQALIWGDLVPQIIVGVTVPRWRNIKPVQVRWMSLHLSRGQNLLTMASLDSALEQSVITSLSRYASPNRVEKVHDALIQGDVRLALANVLPSELYAIASDQSLANTPACGSSLQIRALTAANDPLLTSRAIGETFGTPKPTLAHSYQPNLLTIRTFPTLMGYSSRILAESWESDNMYYAALADELGIPVEQLYADVPQWTRSTVENIFATHLEDWPALLRSLRAVGDTLRKQSTAQASVASYSN